MLRASAMLIRGNARRLIARFDRLGDENKTIGRDMALIMAFALAAKVAGVMKEIAVAWRYGVSEVVDAYLFVLNLVNLPVGIWYSILSVVYIPLAANLRVEGAGQLTRFRSELLGMALLIGLLCGAIFCLGLTVFFHSSLSGLSQTARGLALQIAPWISILIPLGVITHFGSVQMMSERRHANTFFEGIPALALLATVILVASGSIWPLIWGTVAGAAIQMGATALAVSKGGQLEWPQFSMRSPGWKLFWGAMGIMLVGQVLQSLTTIVDQFFAARLDTGDVARLGYASRVLSLILTLGATAVARAILPVFSSMQAKQSGSIDSVARKWSVLMMGLGAAVLLIAWPTARWVVELLFERGAFGSSDTATVAQVLRFALTQVPFYFASLVLAYGLLSRGRYRTVALIAAVNLVTKVAACLLFVPFLGLDGLMLASTAMYAVSCVITWYLYRPEHPAIAQ